MLALLTGRKLRAKMGGFGIMKTWRNFNAPKKTVMWHKMAPRRLGDFFRKTVMSARAGPTRHPDKLANKSIFIVTHNLLRTGQTEIGSSSGNRNGYDELSVAVADGISHLHPGDGRR